MIELTANKLQNAVARAKAESKNLVVRMTGAVRMYRVENRANGNIYTVNFFIRNGKRFGSCDCAAGAQGNYACKHIAAAAALNMFLAKAGALNRMSRSVV